jgi:hypothetical protein
MVNAWSLLWSEINGTMDEDYPIMNKNDDVTIVGGGSSDTITFTSDGVGAADTINIGYPIFGSASPDTIDFGGSHVRGGMGDDHISFSGIAGTQYDHPNYYAVDDVYKFHFPATESIEKPKPDLKGSSNQKYQEDKGIRDLKDYVSSTYQGHYTNENSDVQTLDLIHSVGDAESFCRSNALKYLSRYDKKGSAKNDILKAMHYCLLLYYFSGNTQEPDYTNTRYETF